MQCWAILNFPTGKRLQPFLAELVAQLERHRELTVDPATRGQLLAMSAASIDRCLAPERRRLAIKGRHGTKSGTLLKHQIPVRTWAEWDDATQPGFLEIDLVSRDGGAARGDFASTLDMVDTLTGWTETAAVPNKARKWVLEALNAHRSQFPFPLRGLDSDNGSEFINHHLLAWCETHHIEIENFAHGVAGKWKYSAPCSQIQWTPSLRTTTR